jgi:hypothetical protein
MAGLGEIPPSATLRGYWKLEDVNDSSGNGFTLTNQNTVSFITGKFTNCAQFTNGTSNKGLTLATNPLTSLEPTNISFSFWFRLNNTTSSITNARIFEIVTANNNAGAIRLICYYNISGGNITFTVLTATTGGNRTITLTIPTDSNWHAILVRKVSDTIAINVDVINAAAGGIPDRTTAGLTATYPFVIGNNAFGLVTQCYADIDEFFIREDDFSPPNGYYNYYTQARGRFCI